MAAKSNVSTISSLDALSGFLIASPDALKVVFFYADFHEPSKAGGAMDNVVQKLAELHPGISVAKVDAEAVPDAAEVFDVTVVPTFVFFKQHVMVGTLQGADAAELTRRVEALKDAPKPPLGQRPDFLNEVFARVEAIIASGPVVLFMKGTPTAPRCKFSRRIVELLQAEVRGGRVAAAQRCFVVSRRRALTSSFVVWVVKDSATH